MAVATTLVLTTAGSASAAGDDLPSVQRLISTIQDVPAFAGYQTTSSDRSASVIITVPDAETCDELELSGGYSFMGLESEGSYIFGAVAALCQPGAPGTYGAGVTTPDGGTVNLPGPIAVDDQIKIVLSDNGTETTVTMTNLNGGASVSASTSSVGDNYEVGVTGAFGTPLVDGALAFTKAKVDGGKLKAAGPTKVVFSDPATPTYKPSKLKKGTNFKVTSS